MIGKGRVRWRTGPRHYIRPLPIRTACILLGSGCLLFVGASLLVRANATKWDESVYRSLNQVPPGAATFLTPLSRLFLPLGLTVVVLAASVFCVARSRSLWPIVFCASSATVAWLGANLAKAVADRQRPYEVVTGAVLRQQPAHGTSFPSSHAAIALAVALTVIPFLPRRGVAIALIYAALVAWSRVYLGVHYPLDVIGGAGIGLIVGGGALVLIRLFSGSIVPDRCASPGPDVRVHRATHTSPQLGRWRDPEPGDATATH
jgi:membrane-associated phospholipid phosphatase